MMTIIVDTRESMPWVFPEHLAKTVRGTLKAGDYALMNDYQFAIERKSATDFVGTVSTGWERFLREIERMKDYPAKVILVEASFADIINHNYGHPSVSPSFVCKRIAELVMLGVCVFFADNPVSAAGLCYKILKERMKESERQRPDPGDRH